jgi:RimJ/RimL family protein N-acetyltransferase
VIKEPGDLLSSLAKSKIREASRSPEEVHRGPPINAVSLQDNVIAIGPVMPDDMGALFTWLNDVEAAALDRTYRPIDFAAFKTWLDEAGRGGPQTLFAIRRIAEVKIIGYVTLTNILPIHRSAELNIRIGAESDRGKGYGRRAIKLILAHAFAHLNLHRIQLRALSHNERAIRAYEAAGFVREGLLGHAGFIEGKWVDIVMMATFSPIDG